MTKMESKRDFEQTFYARLKVREIQFAAGFAQLLKRFDEDGDGAGIDVRHIGQVEDQLGGHILIQHGKHGAAELGAVVEIDLAFHGGEDGVSVLPGLGQKERCWFSNPSLHR